jgi:hypothetical protein
MASNFNNGINITGNALIQKQIDPELEIRNISTTSSVALVWLNPGNATGYKLFATSASHSGTGGTTASTFQIFSYYGNIKNTLTMQPNGDTQINGRLLLHSSLVGQPGLYFNSDLDTGIYGIGDGKMGLSANGIKRIEITNTEVTISPNPGSVCLVANSNNDNDTRLTIRNQGTSNTRACLSLETNNGISEEGYKIFASQYNGISAGGLIPSTLQIYAYPSGNNVLTINPNGDMNIRGSFGTNNISMVSGTIIGISSITPNDNILNISGKLIVPTISTSNTTGLSMQSGIRLNINFGNTSSRPPITPSNILSSFVIHGSGTENAGNDGFLQLSAGGGFSADNISYIQLSGYSGIPDMDKNIVFGTVGTERLRITNTGNVGIGTTAPSQKLDVNGNIKANGLNINNGILNINNTFTCTPLNPLNINAFNIDLNNTTLNIYKTIVNTTYNATSIMNTGSNASLLLGTNNNTSICLDGITSNVGIGTTAPSQKLDVNGNTNITGNVTVSGTVTAQDVTASSDMRLKDRISTIQNSLATILQMRGVTYYPINSSVRKIGVIAQEVEKVLPEVVLTDNSSEGFKSVSYGHITGLLIEAIKELSDKVDKLAGI